MSEQKKTIETPTRTITVDGDSTWGKKLMGLGFLVVTSPLMVVAWAKAKPEMDEDGPVWRGKVELGSYKYTGTWSRNE